MQTEHMKTALAGGWVLAWIAVAFAINVSSTSGWTLLATFGLLPPLLLLRMWHRPPPTTSESIRNVLG